MFEQEKWDTVLFATGRYSWTSDNILPPCDTISVSVGIVLHWLLWHYCLFFISIGRAAATRPLGLSRAGVRVDDDGKVVVDQEERTSTPNVYAIGDVAKVFHTHTYNIGNLELAGMQMYTHCGEK